MRTPVLILSVVLLTGVIFPAQAASQTGGLTFHACPIQDTFLIYEPVWVEFGAENTSDKVLPASPLDNIARFVWFDTFDSSGNSIISMRVQANYVRIGADTLTAHGSTSGIGRLDWGVKFWDTLSQRSYIIPGRYRTIFRWELPRLTPSGDSHEHLEDSIAFWVVLPRGDELNAMEEYHTAFQLNGRDRTIALWSCYKRHPHSQYADDCLESILMGGGCSDCGDPALQRSTLSRRFIIDYPNYPTVGREMNRLYSKSERYCPNRGGRRAMNEILDSIPAESRAARMARQLKQTGQKHWGRRVAGPAW